MLIKTKTMKFKRKLIHQDRIKLISKRIKKTLKITQIHKAINKKRMKKQEEVEVKLHWGEIIY